MNTLRQHRKARRMTQYDLEAVTGVSQTYISHMEKHGDLPTKRHARILAAYFGKKIEALFPDGIMPPQERGTDGRFYEKVYLPPVCHPLPRPLALRCWKCGSARISIAETCYQCGAEFWKAEEACCV